MVNPFPFGESITRLRSPERDRYGDQPDVDDQLVITNVGVAWGSTDEDNNFRETTESEATLYVPKSADIVASDHIELADGSRWRVIGRPMWTGVHPITGTDFGIKTIRIREA